MNTSRWSKLEHPRLLRTLHTRSIRTTEEQEKTKGNVSGVFRSMLRNETRPSDLTDSDTKQQRCILASTSLAISSEQSTYSNTRVEESKRTVLRTEK
jgi:hypothetical protein